MSDQIFIEQFIVTAIIGIHPDERVTPQSIQFDLEIATDAARAAHSEKIADTIDYARVCALIRHTAVEGKFQLVETLAERIAQHLINELGVRWLRIRVGKPNAIADAQSVGIQIERGTREDSLL